MFLPFEVVEWSQDDMVRLIHSLETVPFYRQTTLLVNDFDPTKAIRDNYNRAKLAMIPCEN